MSCPRLVIIEPRPLDHAQIKRIFRRARLLGWCDRMLWAAVQGFVLAAAFATIGTIALMFLSHEAFFRLVGGGR